MATAAVTRLATEDGHVTEALKERYQRMARGGVGAIVVEAAVVLPSKSSFNLRMSDDRFISELKELVEGVRTVNSEVKIGLQLIHFLKLARTGWRQKVEDLRLEEIRVIPEQFASAALRAKVAGFDFVELHMAHFTTLASFLSLVNKRKDSYGGDFEGRVKLPTEVVFATRETVGDDFPIGVRINGEEFTKEGNTLLQSTRIAHRLAHLGVDYLSVSAGERFEDADAPPPNTPPFAGTGYSGYRMSPRWWHPDGCQVYLAEGVRKVVREAGYDLPIVAAGKIRTPELAEEILEEGSADVIGMARTLLADPDWPIKAKEGRSDDIVKCAACGYCSEADERYEPVTCIEWPKGALHAPSPWFLVPPCKLACPAGLDIRTYIELIAQGHYEQALRVIEEKIPLPGTVGRVCPRPCEERCNRGHLDTSVAINGLKRFVADRAALNKGRSDTVAAKKTKEERVAIIGSGPAGLTAAFHLVRLGYPTTIYEALAIPGGMLTVGIPEYRLPREVVQREIEDIQKQGVEIRLNSPIGDEKGKLSIHDLWRQGYKAIFIAAGAQRNVKLGGPEIPDLSFLDGEKIRRLENKTIWIDPRTMMTNIEGIFAGGDVVSGPATVIEAIAAGRKAALSIDKYLRGERLEDDASVPPVIGIEEVDTDRFPKRERQGQRICVQASEEKIKGFVRIEVGFTEMEALREADRCLQCGLFPKKPPRPPLSPQRLCRNMENRQDCHAELVSASNRIRCLRDPEPSSG
jgi:2,4-dienoyl-CoA reductase-like NADH-dependent reductase (Old Yellow Enzyme family)